ncbi:MAG: 50S ribosomal protein L1 [Lentisphaeria bacterium]
MSSKLYNEKLSMVDRTKFYSLEEAINLVKQMPKAKFDETLEIAFKLGIDPRKSDQAVRGAVTLPHGTGKSVSILVIADGAQAEAAKAAGADFVGYEELINKIASGWTDFDVMIATPAAMQKVRPLGRVLGPRGLMPNPKTGTVTDDVAVAVEEAKKGRVEFRNDRTACVHVPAGKVSFASASLIDNCKTVISSLTAAQPSMKGHFYLSCTVSSTMGPGVKVDLKDLAKG